MSDPRVIIISGSPSRTSGTAKLGDYVLGRLALAGIAAEHIRLCDLPPEALLRADISDKEIAVAAGKIEHADGVVVATPTYKASYSGLLKVFLDLLPQFGLAGKAILPLASGGSLAHVLALDYALRPVLHSMSARHVVQSYFMWEKHLSVVDGALVIDDAAEGLLLDAIAAFCSALPAGPNAAAH